jgi:hypothetical protein
MFEIDNQELKEMIFIMDFQNDYQESPKSSKPEDETS